MSSVLIKNGKVWTGRKFIYADVFAKDNCIRKIKENLTYEADFVYDAIGKIVSPGFVDVHVHMKGVSGSSFGTSAEGSCFPFGVTAVADASGVNGDKEFLDTCDLKNVVFVCSQFINGKANVDNAKFMLEKYQEKVVGIKIYYDTEVAHVSSLKELEAICDFAHSNKLKVMVHCSNSPSAMSEFLPILKKGDILTHSFHGGLHCASDDDFESIKEAKHRGVIIDLGMAGFVHTDFKVLKDAISNGVSPDTISTDLTKYNVFKRGGIYGMTMCMSILKDLGMDEEEIFTAVTLRPATALGKENEWGCLEIGRPADITVVDYADNGYDMTDKAGNHIYNDKGYKCYLTVCNNEIVYRNK